MPMQPTSLPATGHRPWAAPTVWVVVASWRGSGRDFGGRPNRRAARHVSMPVSAITATSGQTDSDRSRIDITTTARVRTDFDRAFVEHYERLVRTLTVVAGDRESAEDAVQEAFVRAHLRWNRISRYDDPVGWIRRVAINRLRDDHRKRRTGRNVMLRLASRAQVEHCDPELDEFDRILASLPRQQRATTALFYVDGLGVAEIAATLGIAEGSVKSHLFDARQRLRPILTRSSSTPDTSSPGTSSPGTPSQHSASQTPSSQDRP